jgi:spermidine/putrescine transport system substrate-binding protein
MNQNLPEDPQLREMVKAALAHKVTRRAVLGGAVATSAAALLAACAPGDKPSLTPATDVSDSDPTLIWSNWSLYVDIDDEGNYPTLEKFKSETGITVTYREDFDDNDSYFGKVKDQLALGQDIGADVTCPTSWMAARWINQGTVQTFDDAKINIAFTEANNLYFLNKNKNIEPNINKQIRPYTNASKKDNYKK